MAEMTAPSDALRAQYPESYGAQWAPSAPDYTRCCSPVYPSGSYHSRQCERVNGYGAGGAYCKRHDPDQVHAKWEAKRAAREAKWDRESAIRAIEAEREPLIRRIAEGCDDARDLCRDWCERMDRARAER